MYNTSILSWNGELGNLTSEEVLDHMYKPYLDTILLPSKNTTVKFLIPFGFCKVYIEKLPRVTIIKFLPHVESLEYFVFISDPDITNRFQTYDSTIGDKIKLKSRSNGLYIEYRLALTETRKIANDGTCVDYPFNSHHSFGECVDAEIRARILPLRGCMVPWMSSRDQCSQPIPRFSTPQHDSLLAWHTNIGLYAWGGIQYEPETCPRPCNIIAVKSTYQVEGTAGNGTENFIDLYVEKYVKVEKVDFVPVITYIKESF